MIPFTQYMRPMGEPRPVKVERPEPIETLAKELIAQGCRLDCEVLTTGEVSFTVEHENWPATIIASELVANGPTVLPAVDRMIKEAHRLWTGREQLVAETKAKLAETIDALSEMIRSERDRGELLGPLTQKYGADAVVKALGVMRLAEDLGVAKPYEPSEE